MLVCDVISRKDDSTFVFPFIFGEFAVFDMAKFEETSEMHSLCALDCLVSNGLVLGDRVGVPALQLNQLVPFLRHCCLGFRDILPFASIELLCNHHTPPATHILLRGSTFVGTVFLTSWGRSLDGHEVERHGLLGCLVSRRGRSRRCVLHDLLGLGFVLRGCRNVVGVQSPMLHGFHVLWLHACPDLDGISPLLC